jgi:hypothetical protein
MPAVIIYSLKQTDDQLWSVCRMGAAMFNGLQLGPAIKLAREVAREENYRVGEPTFVELHGVDPAMKLGDYRQGAWRATDATA